MNMVVFCVIKKQYLSLPLLVFVGLMLLTSTTIGQTADASPLVEGKTSIALPSLNSVYSNPFGTSLNNPGLTGPCGHVQTWEYGGPNDPNRRITDISGYFNSPSSIVKEMKIEMDAVPLQGVVCYPNGIGPFPLVLIVHGDHFDPRVPSYTGYNYLLEHLASQCMIVVSVEEDFLNGFCAGEMDARGIVLLRHLQLWREWNRTPGHPFYRKVDMNNIGLAGHSRGGEAIVVAQNFNKTKHIASHPRVGVTSHNFNFGIKALYAMAPVDGLIDETGGRVGLTISNADYYIMHGTHDGATQGIPGQRVYNRALPIKHTTSKYKGFLWIYGANHGQWNTVWDTCCEASVPPSILRISAKDQMQFAKTYMGAFFMASLKGVVAYRNFLSGEVTFASLPSSIPRIFQYQDPKRLFINHFEEDKDVTTTSIVGGKNFDVGTFKIYENKSFNENGSPNFLWGETNGLIAGWNKTGTEMHIRMPIQAIRNRILDYKFLAFHAGQTHESTPLLNLPGTNRDFVVQLEFNGILGPEVKVSSYQPLIYPLITTHVKSIQQTIRIPFADLKGSGNFRVRDITVIRLKFNQSATGNVAIDEIQFTN